MTPTVTTPAFDRARLGTDRNGITVQLLAFPQSDAPLLDKVQAFAYFEEIIRQHRPQLTALTVQQAHADNVPVSSSASAAEEANRISYKLHDSFFHVANLTCLGFFTSDGKEASVALDPSHRASDISFVKFSATVVPSTFSLDLVNTPPSTVHYFLKLPQATPPSKPSNRHVETVDSDPPSSPEPDHIPGNPDMSAVAAIREVFAAGGNADDLMLTSPKVKHALASLINHQQATPKPSTMFTPDSACVNLFPATETPPAASPSIRRYLTNATSTMLPTYCGPLNFLDNQALFDAIFPTNDRKPILSLLSPRASATTTVSTDDAETAIQVCLSECRMLVFKSIIRLDYIGHHNFGSSDHLQLTVQRIRKLHLKYNERGVAINGSPDRLFDKYLALIPLLPATHVNSWGINLFSQFWTSLGDELTRKIAQLPRYIAISSSTFDLTTMTTKASQMHALRELRSLAVESWSTLQDDKRNMRLMLQEMAPHNNNRSNRSNSHHLDASANTSSAEETMQRYQRPEPSSNQSIQTNYQNPAPGGLVSDYASDFRGCLGCGGADHVFRSCPMKSDPATKERFHRNFNIKFNRPQMDPRPAIRESPYGPSTRPPGPPPAFGQQTTPGSGRGTSNQPAWMTRQNHSRTDGPSGSRPLTTSRRRQSDLGNTPSSSGPASNRLAPAPPSAPCLFVSITVFPMST
jgi:hypothetical protein